MDSTYERIVKSGYKRFAQFGIKGLNIDQVTADIGMTKGAFYKHGFNVTKDQLVLDVLNYGKQEMEACTVSYTSCQTIDELEKASLVNEVLSNYIGQLWRMEHDDTTQAIFDEVTFMSDVQSAHMAYVTLIEKGYKQPTDEQIKNTQILIVSFYREGVLNINGKSYEALVSEFFKRLRILVNT